MRREKKKKKEANERELHEKHRITIIMCKELLWNEIRANHYSLVKGDVGIIQSIIEKKTNHYFDGGGKFRVENWLSIREKVIEDNLECAIKVIGLYKYYEYMSLFSGSAKEAGDLSQLDFSKYFEIYEDVTKYLGIKE